MGDRANIEMVYESGEKIYFYTHWSGSELPEILQNALNGAKEDGTMKHIWLELFSLK